MDLELDFLPWAKSLKLFGLVCFYGDGHGKIESHRGRACWLISVQTMEKFAGIAPSMKLFTTREEGIRNRNLCDLVMGPK